MKSDIKKAPLPPPPSLPPSIPDPFNLHCLLKLKRSSTERNLTDPVNEGKKNRRFNVLCRWWRRRRNMMMSYHFSNPEKVLKQTFLATKTSLFFYKKSCNRYEVLKIQDFFCCFGREFVLFFLTEMTESLGPRPLQETNLPPQLFFFSAHSKWVNLLFPSSQPSAPSPSQKKCVFISPPGVNDIKI